MSEPEAKKDPVVALLEEVRDELRGKEKRWFQRTPFKEMLIHSSTVLFAGCVGWLAHAASGGAVNIEVASRASSAPEVAAAPAAPAIDVPADIEQEVVAVASAVASTSSSTPKAKKNIEDNALAVVVFPRPPPPAAAPSAAPPASASARAAAPAAAAPAKASTF
jgi:hypothetical protein